MHSMLPLTAGKPLAAHFHRTGHLKEIPVSSLEQYPHIKKCKYLDSSDKHDIGHSKLERTENCDVQKVVFNPIRWTVKEERKRQRLF